MEINKLNLVILKYFSIATENDKYVSLVIKPIEKTKLSTDEEKELFLKNEVIFRDDFLNYIELFMNTPDLKEKKINSKSDIFMALNFLKHLGFILQDNGGDRFSFKISKLGYDFLKKESPYYRIYPKFEDFFILIG